MRQHGGGTVNKIIAVAMIRRSGASMSDPGGFGPLAMDECEAIGPYRIVGRMGAGGMGVVYAGVAADGARVAVKVIHPGLAADPHFHARFVREVDLLSRV